MIKYSLILASILNTVFPFMALALSYEELAKASLTGQVLGVTTTGQVAYWPMDESSGTYISDAGGAGYTGSLTGGSFVAGKVNNGLALNGSSQYASIQDNSTLRLANSAYTISAWIYNTDSNYLANSRGIISKFNNNGYLMAISNGKLFVVHSGSSGSNSIFGTTTLLPNSWYHVAMVYDRSTLKAFVNGTLQGTKNVSSDLVGENFPLSIGSYNGSYFLGTIDEVRIYNRNLSDTEINDIYLDPGSAPTPTPTPTPTVTPTPTPTPTLAPTPTPTASQGSVWYASPTGTSFGNGSINNPWDLQTALDQTATIQPGHTLYLRGGTYNGPFRSNLSGNSSARVIVRSYPGENAILDNPNNSAITGWAPGASPSLFVGGSYARYERLTITNSSPQRSWGAEYINCYPNCRGAGVVDLGDGNQFIHNIIHDTGEAFESQGAAQNGSLYYGNITYYIGWMDTQNNTGRGHAFYVQNDCTARKTLENNIDFWSFSTSQQIYGSSGASVRCLDSIGNVIFGSGRLVANGEGGIIVGGNAGASDIKIIDNIVYQADCNLMPRVNAFRPAYLIAPSYYEIRNNYFKGCKAVDYTLSLPSLTHSGNTWVGTLGNDPALVQTQFAGDSFYSYAGDTTNRVVEKWSSYDSSWGYLVFINNTGASTISWVPAGCGSGQSVELRDVMNHSGAPVQTFSCDGTPKTVNTNYSGPVLAPVGSVANQPVHTGNGFRVFTLTKTGSAGNPTPTPTPTPIPGDLNLDRIINSLDFSLLNGRWNQNYSAYDLFIDSIINTFDYAILKNNWGRTW